MEKGENSGKQHFLFFSQCFYSITEIFFICATLRCVICRGFQSGRVWNLAVMRERSNKFWVDNTIRNITFIRRGWILSTGRTSFVCFLPLLSTLSIALSASPIAHLSIGSGKVFCTRSSTSWTTWGSEAQSVARSCIINFSTYSNASFFALSDEWTCLWT